MCLKVMPILKNNDFLVEFVANFVTPKKFSPSPVHRPFTVFSILPRRGITLHPEACPPLSPVAPARPSPHRCNPTSDKLAVNYWALSLQLVQEGLEVTCARFVYSIGEQFVPDNVQMKKWTEVLGIVTS